VRLSLQVWQSGPHEDEYIVCDGTGEDPTCSDSLQYWDRSIAAHLVRNFSRPSLPCTESLQRTDLSFISLIAGFASFLAVFPANASYFLPRLTFFPSLCDLYRYTWVT
jgi:hypothetical protein